MRVEASELTVEARLENLPALLGHVQRTCAGADPAVSAALRLAVEEVVVNIVQHGYPEDRPGPIRVACRASARDVVITVTDEATPFDPACVPPPPLDAPLEERPLGGLGWHLVRQVVDEVRHQVTPTGGNRWTLVKRIAPG